MKPTCASTTCPGQRGRTSPAGQNGCDVVPRAVRAWAARQLGTTMLAEAFQSFPGVIWPNDLLFWRKSLQRFRCFAVIGIEAKHFSIRRDRVVAVADL